MLTIFKKPMGFLICLSFLTCHSKNPLSFLQNTDSQDTVFEDKNSAWIKNTTAAGFLFTALYAQIFIHEFAHYFAAKFIGSDATKVQVGSGCIIRSIKTTGCDLKGSAV